MEAITDMIMEGIRVRRSRKTYGPGCSPDPSEPAVCTRYERCRSCSYPSHGFICWHTDGSCLKTNMDRIYRKKEVTPAC